jgi:hypothetical protein
MSHRVLDNKLISLGPFHEIYIDGPAIRDSEEYGWKDMTAMRFGSLSTPTTT